MYTDAEGQGHSFTSEI